MRWNEVTVLAKNFRDTSVKIPNVKIHDIRQAGAQFVLYMRTDGRTSSFPERENTVARN
jgi:hypothetical protein